MLTACAPSLSKKKISGKIDPDIEFKEYMQGHAYGKKDWPHFTEF